MKFLDWDHKMLRRCAILVLGLLSVVMIYREIFGRNGYLTLQQQKKQYSNLRQKIQKLSEDNQQLEQKIKALKSNPEAIEKQARDQLHMIKPGEFVYVLPGKKQAQSSTSAQKNPPAKTQTDK